MTPTTEPRAMPERGFVAIAVTPLTTEGAVDYAGIAPLMDFYINCGATGVTLLGVMGEAHRMTDSDARTILDAATEAIAGRVSILAGISDASLQRVASLAEYGMNRGCAGVMLQPLAGLQGDATIAAYIKRVADELGPEVPICVQDFPKASNVHISVDVWRQIVDSCPTVVMLKHEDEPGLGKLSAIREAELAGLRRVTILTGNNGIHLVQELDRGADGAMTGFAFPDALARVIEMHGSGAREQAEDLFDRYLPVNRHELRTGIAMRKEILHRRGALATARARFPARPLTAIDHAELGRLLQRLEQSMGHPITELER